MLSCQHPSINFQVKLPSSLSSLNKLKLATFYMLMTNSNNLNLLYICIHLSSQLAENIQNLKSFSDKLQMPVLTTSCPRMKI